MHPHILLLRLMGFIVTAEPVAERVAVWATFRTDM